MYRGQTPGVARVEQLQEIKGFPAANLSQDDSVGPVPKRRFQQVADGDGGKIVLRRSGFEAHEVVLRKMDFRRVLDEQNPFVRRYEFAEHIEQ